MKILLINNDKGWSGGQEHLKDLAAELTKCGQEIHFAVREGSKSDNRLRELGLPVHALAGHGIGDLKALFKLVRLLWQEHFDVVSVNREHDLLSAAVAWHLAFPFRKKGKFMMSYHTATKRLQPLLGTADGILCISEHVRTQLLKGNPKAADRITVVQYGITLQDPPLPEKFNPDRARRFFKDAGFPLIGMIGEFWKNQGELIGMIPALRSAFPGIKVAFVGDNTDQGLITPIMAQIRSLGLEDAVIFTGRVPRERIPEIFFDFDLSVTTHRNEGFGIVHLESLAAGTPVVSYDEGGMVDIFRSCDAGIVVHGGPAEFSAAVLKLLSDNELRYRLGRNGYDLVERQYSLTDMGRRYLEYYHAIVNGSPVSFK